MSQKHFFFKAIVLFALFFSFFSACSLHAAILDDLVENIESHIPNKKQRHPHKHYRHYSHQHHTLSQQAQWQTALKFLGYYQGKIDGDLFNKSFFNAVIAFHQDQGEIATGFLEETDKRYLSKVYHTVLLNKYLSYHGTNKQKKAQKIQAALTILSYYHGKIDGYFKAHSKEALNRYSNQYDENMSKKEIENHLIDEAKSNIKEVIGKIKKRDFNPSTNVETDEGNISSSL